MIRLRVFGSMELRDGDDAELRAVLAQPKRLGLLVYLATHRNGAFVRRDTLLPMFWPEADDASARSSLNQAVRFLRRHAGHDDFIMSRGAEELGVNRALLWCDVTEFRERISRRELDAALQLYQGDFLTGFHVHAGGAFDAWAEDERSALRTLAGSAARTLAEQLEREGNLTGAVLCARRALELSDVDERRMRELLALLDRAGDRAGAMAAFDRFVARLASEYDTQPSAETLALVERIRARVEPNPRLIEPSIHLTREPAPPEAPAATEVPAGRSVRSRASRVFAASGATLALVLAALYAAPRRPLVWDPGVLGATAQLTNSSGLDLDPAYSPDGRRIAYAAGSAGATQIYVRPISGGSAVLASSGSGRMNRWPSWSPDGDRLVFLATDADQDTEHSRLIIVSPLGGTRELVADNVTYYSTPAWSPDGRYIAYPLADSIILYDVHSKSRRAVGIQLLGRAPEGPSTGELGAIHSLAWSRDARHIAFVSGNPTFNFASLAFGNTSPSDIWTMDLRDGKPVRLTRGAFGHMSPVWTADGQDLLWVSNEAGAWDVYHQPLDRAARPIGVAQRLTTGLNARGISLSRDGTYLAYTLMNYRSNIFAAPIHADATTAVTELKALTDGNQVIETVDVSADGRWLVFDSSHDGRSHIYKMPVEGRDPIRLTNDDADDFAPMWSQDGRWIAFHRRQASKEGHRDIFVANANGGERTRITADSLDDAYPHWLPDGHGIVYGNGRMVALRSRDGQWSAPRPDSTPGRLMADGRHRWQLKGPSAYVRGEEGPPRLVASGESLGGRIMSAVFDRDTSTVYFRVVEASGTHAFYAVPVRSGSPRLLLRLSEGFSNRPARVIFSTDTRRLFFTITDASSNIWQVKLRR